MSKKNNQCTRRKQHAFDLQREAAVKKKAAAKAAAKQKLATKPKDMKKGKKGKGIRIRKNVVVAGIKVKDAASKRAALEAVKERRQVASMEVDDQ